MAKNIVDSILAKIKGIGGFRPLVEAEARGVIEFTIEELTATKPKSTVQDAATAQVSSWNYDMESAPRGAKVLLLNEGGVACIGIAAATRYARGGKFIAWAPFPKRNHDVETLLKWR